MKRFFLPLSLFAALSLGACANQSLPAPSANAPLAPLNAVVAKLGKFTVTDINNAEAIAKANNDQIAMACYPTLAAFVQSLPANNGSTQTVSGAISAFEQARVLRLQITGAITGNTNTALTKLRLACSPLLMSEQQFLANMGILAAGGSVAAPALGAGATAIGSVLAAPFGN